jgi:hypothetical protein
MRPVPMSFSAKEEPPSWRKTSLVAPHRPGHIGGWDSGGGLTNLPPKWPLTHCAIEQKMPQLKWTAAVLASSILAGIMFYGQ